MEMSSSGRGFRSNRLFDAGARQRYAPLALLFVPANSNAEPHVVMFTTQFSIKLYPLQVIKHISTAAIVSLLVTTACAEKIDLVCTKVTGDESLAYLIDTTANTVSREGDLANEVRILPDRIFFSYSYKNTTFMHSINRITGRLSVQSAGISVGGTHLCDRNRPKF